MIISKEVPPPVQTDYRLILTEEEFRVVIAALGVADFKDINDYLDRKRGGSHSSKDLAFKIYSQMEGFRA